MKKRLKNIFEIEHESELNDQNQLSFIFKKDEKNYRIYLLNGDLSLINFPNVTSFRLSDVRHHIEHNNIYSDILTKNAYRRTLFPKLSQIDGERLMLLPLKQQNKQPLWVLFKIRYIKHTKQHHPVYTITMI